MAPNDESAAESDWLTVGNITREVRDVLRSRHLTAVSAWQMLPPQGGKYTNEGSAGIHRVSRSKDAMSHITNLIQIISRDPEKESNFPDAEYSMIKMRKGIKGKRGKIIKDFAKGRVLNDPFYICDAVIQNDMSEFDNIDENELIEIFGE
jgi:hypothetical protein